MADYRSGFVTLVGRPNVGKSTLLNHIIGKKIAIMSDKAQTTRNQIRGVFHSQEGQIIFIDTPGIHKPQSKLGEYLVKSSLSTFAEVDVVLVLIDAVQGIGAGDRYIIDQLKRVQTPVYLLLNKIDQTKQENLLPLIEQYRALYPWREVVPISALKGTNTTKLVELIFNELPKGPAYYPEDQVTDYPEHFIIAEIIREKILQLTREEIPHSVAVIIERIESDEEDPEAVLIYANIYVERKSQKGILIGKDGSLLKEVKSRARRELKRLLGNRINLDLWVKVKKDWRNEEFMLRQLGYRTME